MRLTVLGCSGSYPGPGGACSGYLVQGGGATVWLDAGPGTLANLQRHVSLADVDAIVLSHEHPDHWSDLEGYFVATRYGEAQLQRGMPVFAPAGLRGLAYHAGDEWFEWREIADRSEIDVGGLHLAFSRTDHGPVTLAARVDDGAASFAYSADTGPGWSFAAFGRDPVDLALCEATMPVEREGEIKHMSGRQAAVAAAEGGASRLVLTHIWPTLDHERSRADAAAVFAGPVDLAADHLVFEL